MSIFLLKTLEGADYVPPTCDGLFADVSCPSLFGDWIEDLFLRQMLRHQPARVLPGRAEHP